jgi:integrase/recombinase XerD
VAPHADRAAIHAELRTLKRSSSATDKRARLRDSDTLTTLGLTLMNASELRARAHWADAVTFRTGLQIALLAPLPYRLQIFSGIEWLDTEPPAYFMRPFLIKQHGRWLIGYNDQSNTYKAVPARLYVPVKIVSRLEDYLFGGIRKTLCTFSGYSGQRLWVSTRGGALGPNGLYKRIVKATKDAFDQSVNPHLFRDCYATSSGRDWHAGGIAAYAVLGNSPEVAARVYTHDLGTLAAGREMARMRGMLRSPSANHPAPPGEGNPGQCGEGEAHARGKTK